MGLSDGIRQQQPMGGLPSISYFLGPGVERLTFTRLIESILRPHQRSSLPWNCPAPITSTLSRSSPSLCDSFGIGNRCPPDQGRPTVHGGCAFVDDLRLRRIRSMSRGNSPLSCIPLGTEWPSPMGSIQRRGCIAFWGGADPNPMGAEQVRNPGTWFFGRRCLYRFVGFGPNVDRECACHIHSGSRTACGCDHALIGHRHVVVRA